MEPPDAGRRSRVMAIAGADWFEGRWLTVSEDASGVITVALVSTFTEFIPWTELEFVVVDIPIGLPDRGGRACDLQARRMIRPRGSSVFPAPIRPILGARDRVEASRIRYQIEQKRCSAQAFAIVPIVADVDRAMWPHIQRRIREGHPEVSFAQMNDGAGLTWPKRTPEGHTERVGRLEPYFPDLRSHMEALRPRRALVDLLDAFAMLWTARRIRAGLELSIPEGTEYDSRGLRMEMVV